MSSTFATMRRPTTNGAPIVFDLDRPVVAPLPQPARRQGSAQVPLQTGPSMTRPGILGALFDPLPEGWQERKSLARDRPELPDRDQPAQAAAKTEEANRAPPPRIPGAPKNPWELSRASWFAVFKRLIHELGADRVTSVAGGVTFFSLLALFPAITALVSIYGLVADPASIADSLSMLDAILPESAIELIGGQVAAIASASDASLSIAGVAAIVIALWTANGGMKALIEAMNIAWFETEKRGFIRLNLVSMAMTLGAILGIIVIMVLVAVLPILLAAVMAGTWVEAVVAWLRWPLLLGIVMTGLAVLYRFGPSKEDPVWQWISPGALLATAGLLIASALFSWYVANLANYNETYGSLGAAVVMMMWLWIAAIVVLVGAELNSEVERQIKIENGVAPKTKDDLNKH